MTNTDREKIKEALEAIVPDAELNAAWGSANFGHDDKRSVIMDTLWKVVCGYGTSSTALCICTDLKLIKGYRTRRGEVTLTKRGQDYFREAAYHRASQAATKPAGGEITVSQEFIDQLWTNAQEIAYHAEMDTVKGKRRGHWILPKAMEVIKAVEQYATPPLTRKENGE